MVKRVRVLAVLLAVTLLAPVAIAQATPRLESPARESQSEKFLGRVLSWLTSLLDSPLFNNTKAILDGDASHGDPNG